MQEAGAQQRSVHASEEYACLRAGRGVRESGAATSAVTLSLWEAGDHIWTSFLRNAEPFLSSFPIVYCHTVPFDDKGRKVLLVVFDSIT